MASGVEELFFTKFVASYIHPRLVFFYNHFWIAERGEHVQRSKNERRNLNVLPNMVIALLAANQRGKPF